MFNKVIEEHQVNKPILKERELEIEFRTNIRKDLLKVK